MNRSNQVICENKEPLRLQRSSFQEKINISKNQKNKGKLLMNSLSKKILPIQTRSLQRIYLDKMPIGTIIVPFDKVENGKRLFKKQSIIISVVSPSKVLMIVSDSVVMEKLLGTVHPINNALVEKDIIRYERSINGFGRLTCATVLSEYESMRHSFLMKQGRHIN